MTFLTRDLGVQPGERVAGLGVVELRSIFPVLEVVALLTILSQAAIVLVLMTVHAVRADSQESSALVANLDGKHFRLCNMLRRVTTIAGQSRVFSLQAVSGFAVIEPGRSRRPFHDREIEAIVFGVTLSAFLTGIGFQSIGSVKSASGSQAGGNLAVTVETTQRTGGAQLMARSAIDRAVQRLMRLRQRTGRNLRYYREHKKVH